MYKDDFSLMTNAAKTKAEFYKTNPGGFFVSSMLAGVFIGIGVFLSFTIGSLLEGQAHARIAMGIPFCIALSLVIIAGAELFTGSNLVMTAGISSKTASLGQTLKLWIFCYIGNWFGSIIISLVFLGTGLEAGPLGAFIDTVAVQKTTLAFSSLFFRAVLCNTLVCLAVWSSFRCKSESGKLLIIFWCMFAFVTTGFEHCVANMTLLTISLINSGIGIGAYFYNILVATLGNMVGGILFVALPYCLIARKD